MEIIVALPKTIENTQGRAIKFIYLNLSMRIFILILKNCHFHLQILLILSFKQAHSLIEEEFLNIIYIQNSITFHLAIHACMYFYIQSIAACSSWTLEFIDECFCSSWSSIRSSLYKWYQNLYYIDEYLMIIVGLS